MVGIGLFALLMPVSIISSIGMIVLYINRDITWKILTPILTISISIWLWFLSTCLLYGNQEQFKVANLPIYTISTEGIIKQFFLYENNIHFIDGSFNPSAYEIEIFDYQYKHLGVIHDKINVTKRFKIIKKNCHQ